MNQHISIDMSVEDVFWVAKNLLPSPEMWHSRSNLIYCKLQNIDSLFDFVKVEIFEVACYTDIERDLTSIFHSIVIAYCVIHHEKLKDHVTYSKRDSCDMEFELPMWIKSESDGQQPNIYCISRLEIVKTFDPSTRSIRAPISKMFLDCYSE